MSFVFLNARKCHFATPVMFHFVKIETFESQKSKIFAIKKILTIVLDFSLLTKKSQTEKIRKFLKIQISSIITDRMKFVILHRIFVTG